MLRIDLIDERSSFVPGEEILGVASWDVATVPDRAEVRLFWHTSGKGDTDVGIVDSCVWERPAASAAESFRFVAPDGPYSYHGVLIAIQWSLELVVTGVREAARGDIVVAPAREPVTPATPVTP